MALIKIQARFLDERVFNDIKEDCHKYGVFKREPDLDRFLVSEVGQAAGHKIQYAFEKDHGELQCRKLIAEYTQCGGDNGLTLTHMRQACGLRRISGDKAETPALAAIVPSQDARDLDEPMCFTHIQNTYSTNLLQTASSHEINLMLMRLMQNWFFAIL